MVPKASVCLEKHVEVEPDVQRWVISEQWATVGGEVQVGAAPAFQGCENEEKRNTKQNASAKWEVEGNKNGLTENGLR